MDGLNARLSSESHVLPAASDGQAVDFTGCETTMSVFQGTQDDTANWSFVASETGVTGALVGSTYTVTGMSGDVGFVDITASKAGQANITARFSVAKARKGDAGPSISLVSSGQGFTFQDGVATPASQNMSVTVVRQGINDPVTFVASNGKSVRTDLGQLAVLGYLVGAPGVGRGDTAYFDLGDIGSDRQVTITAFCGTMSASVTLLRLDFSTADAGATVGGTIGVNIGGQINADNASTYIADAAIGNAKILGKLTAEKINGQNLEVMAGAYTGYAWPAAGQQGFYLGPNGLLLGNANNGKYVQATADGNLYLPGMKAENGTLTINQANVINTLNIAGNAVSGTGISAGMGTASTNIFIPAGVTASVFCTAHMQRVITTNTNSELNFNLFVTGVGTDTRPQPRLMLSNGEFNTGSYFADTSHMRVVFITGPATVSASAWQTGFSYNSTLVSLMLQAVWR